MIKEVSKHPLYNLFIGVKPKEVALTSQGKCLVQWIKLFRRDFEEIPKEIIISDRVRLFSSDRSGNREFFGIKITDYPDMFPEDAYLVRKDPDENMHRVSLEVYVPTLAKG